MIILFNSFKTEEKNVKKKKVFQCEIFSINVYRSDQLLLLSVDKHYDVQI